MVKNIKIIMQLVSTDFIGPSSVTLQIANIAPINSNTNDR